MSAEMTSLFNDCIPVSLVKTGSIHEHSSCLMQLNITLKRSQNNEKELQFKLSSPDDVEFRYGMCVSQQEYADQTAQFSWANDFPAFQEWIINYANLIRESRISPLKCSLASDQETCRIDFTEVEKSTTIGIILVRAQYSLSRATKLLRKEKEEQARTIASLREQCVLDEERFKSLESKWTSLNEEMEKTQREQEVQLKDKEEKLKEQDRKLRDQEIDLKCLEAKSIDQEKNEEHAKEMIVALQKDSVLDKEKIKNLEDKLEKFDEFRMELLREANLKIKEQEIKLKDQGDRIHELENVLEVSNLKNKEQEDKIMKLGASIEELNTEKNHIEEFLEKSDRRLELVQDERDGWVAYLDNIERVLNALRVEKKEVEDELKLVHYELATEKSLHDQTRSYSEKAWNLLSKCMDNEPKKTSIYKKSAVGQQNSFNVNQSLKQFHEIIGRSKENRSSAESWINESEDERRGLVCRIPVEHLLVSEAQRQRALEHLDQNELRNPFAATRPTGPSIQEPPHVVSETLSPSAASASKQFMKSLGSNILSPYDSLVVSKGYRKSKIAPRAERSEKYNLSANSSFEKNYQDFHNISNC